ncbi:hypothetical protein E1B28_007892 [Marasmius oreades]|uniref:Uncharacterized protein n=1 Tax=Marasmius oreades TaxID=181124 RepID=A0A9P7S2M5_9AGAR|nr:uncharacterized protein E1B28_007892 [Marasmius oreades]KAG7094289.1 hypothetical protein E1B28_007892 [Marasmius oreades]
MSDTINSTKFLGAGLVYIRNQSGNYADAFVSKLSHDSGSDYWFSVPTSFDDPGAKWDRSDHDWEVIGFKDEGGKQVGFYVDLEKFTTYVTVHTVSQSGIQIVQVGP